MAVIKILVRADINRGATKLHPNTFHYSKTRATHVVSNARLSLLNTPETKEIKNKKE